MILKNLAITVKSRGVTIGGAEIKHMRVLPAAGQIKGVKLGLLFTEIKPGDTQWIASYVFEESRKFFARFM